MMREMLNWGCRPGCREPQQWTALLIDREGPQPIVNKALASRWQFGPHFAWSCHRIYLGPFEIGDGWASCSLWVREYSCQCRWEVEALVPDSSWSPWLMEMPSCKLYKRPRLTHLLISVLTLLVRFATKTTVLVSHLAQWVSVIFYPGRMHVQLFVCK